MCQCRFTVMSSLSLTGPFIGGPISVELNHVILKENNFEFTCFSPCESEKHDKTLYCDFYSTRTISV